MPICEFCNLSVDELHPNSHIVPEWMYKHGYDSKHRMIRWDLYKAEMRIIQQGIRDSFLCHKCEDMFAKDDDFAAKMFDERSNSATRKNLNMFSRYFSGELKYVRFTGIEFKKFQSFIFSVIIRWHLSKSISKTKTLTKEYYLRLKNIYETDLMDDDVFPIVMFKLNGDPIINGNVMLPQLERFLDHRVCKFMGAGYMFYVFISKHTRPQELKSIKVNLNGTANAICLKYEETKSFKMSVKDALKANKVLKEFNALFGSVK